MRRDRSWGSRMDPAREELCSEATHDLSGRPLPLARLFGRDRLVDDVRTRAHDAEVHGGIVEKGSRRGGRLGLPALVEKCRVAADHIAQRGDIFIGRRRPEIDLRAFREAVAQSALVEAALRIVAQEHDAAAHARADPATGIAQDHRAATGHVLEREAAQVATEEDLGAGEPDARARIRAALDVEAPALRAVAEALPHRAIDPRTAAVARLEHGERSAERGLRRTVLRAAGDDHRDALGRVRPEAVARDGAVAGRWRTL